jgi:hypothetical protein
MKLRYLVILPDPASRSWPDPTEKRQVHDHCGGMDDEGLYDDGAVQ